MLEAARGFSIPSSNVLAVDPDVVGSIALPQVADVQLQFTDTPSVDLDVSSLGLDSLDLSSPMVLGGLAAVLILTGAVAASGGGDSSAGKNKSSAAGAKKEAKEPDVPTICLAIPYDAAARLAYDKWCKDKEASFDQAAYEAFKDVYETKAVADAISKKKSRDLDNFQNQGKKPIPKRNIAVLKPKGAPTKEKLEQNEKADAPFFFAS